MEVRSEKLSEIPGLGTATQTPASTRSWTYQADVVVIGSGAAGMSAAIAAREAGVSVLVVEMNYDIGGHAITSGGMTDLGGGNAAQKAYGVSDSADLVFADLTSPVAGAAGTSLYQDRTLSLVEADNNVATFDWLLSNGVRFTDVALPNTPPNTRHWISASNTPRTHYPYWNEADKFPPSAASPTGTGGTGIMRPLEASARLKGVEFLLNYRMTSIIRQEPYAGRVLGITAVATGGRFLPGSTTPLQPYASQGNIGIGGKTDVSIGARKAVVVATGGSSSSVERRRVFDVRLTDVYSVGGEPYSFQTGDGEYAAQRIGASLWATGNQTAERGSELSKPGRIGCRYGYKGLRWLSSSPIFPLVRAVGLTVVNWSDVLQVNMAGVRFVDESTSGYGWVDACMNINAASKPPDWAAGPIWTIFDSAAATRESWDLGSPYTDPLFFFQANDIPTLAQRISSNVYQTTPMDGTTLQNTIARYNSLVDAGKDADFGKAPINYKISAPPYYAAFSAPCIHDCLTGLRINNDAHVIDLDGNVIPGLYAAGESAGGLVIHGLAKCFTLGVIAGRNASREPF